jgi:hypothetical protein
MACIGFNLNLEEKKTVIAGLSDEHKELLGKAALAARGGFHLTAIGYLAVVLVYYQSLEDDKDNILSEEEKTLPEVQQQALIKEKIKENNTIVTTITGYISDLRDRYAKSIISEVSEREDKQMPEPVPKDKITIYGDIPLNYEMLSGLYKEKEEMKRKFIYPSLYPHLFLLQKNNVLMFGSAGVGKTEIARASCNEFGENTDILFFNVPADSMRSKWEGGTEKRIASIFNNAKTKAEKSAEKTKRKTKSILFIDEVEAVARDRASGGDDRAITSILQQMEGFASSDIVMVLAATNFPWKLDTAFLRRFEELLFVDLPDLRSRFEMLFSTFMGKFWGFSGFSEVENKRYRQRVYTTTLVLGDVPKNFSKTDVLKNLINQKSELLSDDKDIIEKHVNKEYERIQIMVPLPMNCISPKQIKKNWTRIAKFLYSIAKAMGTNMTMKKYIPDKPKLEYGEYTFSLFGYSNSDIKKVINEYFSLKAAKIIDFQKYEEVKESINMVNYGRKKSEEEKDEQDEKDEQAIAEEKDLCSCYGGKKCYYGGKEGIPYSGALGQEEKMLDVFVDDYKPLFTDTYSSLDVSLFCTALENFTSVVGNDVSGYIDMYNYSKTKTTPSKREEMSYTDPKPECMKKWMPPIMPKPEVGVPH